MSSNFITNKERFLSDIINGILPKTDAVCMLIGYFYYSGYVQLSEQLRDKQIRILVGLDAELQIAKYVREVEAFRKGLISRNVAKEEYYKQFVLVFNNSDFLDTAEKQEQFKMFYGKILDGTLEIRKTLEPCHSKMYLFAYNDTMNENGELPGVLITGSSNLSYQGLKGRLELNALVKVKLFINKQLLPKDYLDDLCQVVQADALSGYEIRYINQLAVKDAAKLPRKISAEYLARVIIAQNKVDDSEETLILSEVLQ